MRGILKKPTKAEEGSDKRNFPTLKKENSSYESLEQKLIDEKR